VILSAANQHAPWITYEAGALAKSVEAPVATLLLDLIPSDVTGPLESFQATVFTSPDDVRRLFVEIAQLADTAMPERSVSILFEAAWSSLRDSWTPPTSDDAAHEPRRDEADMLSELVNRMRRMELRLADPDRSPRKLTKEWVKDPEGKVERLKFTATPSVGIVATLISLLSAYANGDASARDELLELGVDPDRKAASVNDAIMQITNDMKKPSD